MPARFVIGLMVFLATTFAYMLSFNFSINLLAMVQTFDANGTQLPLPNVSDGLANIRGRGVRTIH